MCVKDGVWQSCVWKDGVWKMVCDKDVCVCVKDGVWQSCMWKDGVWKVVCDKEEKEAEDAEAGEEGGGADLKTRTPHKVLGKYKMYICYSIK